MILNTKLFQEAANKILLAVSADKTNIANVELEAKEKMLYLRVTNKEFYVGIKFNLDSDETFRAVVDANLFLNLVSSITADTFELDIKDNRIQTIKFKLDRKGGSSYTAKKFYDNVMAYEEGTDYKISRALDGGTEEDVRKYLGLQPLRVKIS